MDEIWDLNLRVGDDVAFGRSLNRLAHLVHDHVSVPTDFATGEALLELRPSAMRG